MMCPRAFIAGAAAVLPRGRRAVPITFRSLSSPKGLLCTELLRERLYAVVCDTHTLARQKSVTLAQLTGKPFLSLKDGHCFRENVAAMFERAKVEPRITFESGCFLTILNMVKAGIGISVVPEMAVKNQAGCRFIPIQDQQPVRVVCLVQTKNGRSDARAGAANGFHPPITRFITRLKGCLILSGAAFRWWYNVRL